MNLNNFCVSETLNVWTTNSHEKLHLRLLIISNQQKLYYEYFCEMASLVEMRMDVLSGKWTPA